MKPKIIINGGAIPAFGINKLINPRKDIKFSPNLWKFLTYRNQHLTNVFQDPETGHYFIGLRDDHHIWIGAKLMEVFCKGSKAEKFSYSVSISSQWTDVTKWFWDKYLEVGKNIYDLPDWKQLQKSFTN